MLKEILQTSKWVEITDTDYCFDGQDQWRSEKGWLISNIISVVVSVINTMKHANSSLKSFILFVLTERFASHIHFGVHVN
jgi:hypothetical protein